VLSAGGFWIAASLALALVDASDKRRVTGPAFQAVNAIGSDFFVPFVAGTGGMLFAAGLGTGRSGTPLPRWPGWAGIALGVLTSIPWVGFFAFHAAGPWFIAASLLLARRATAGATDGTRVPMRGVSYPGWVWWAP
jgi:hypothetical protein